MLEIKCRDIIDYARYPIDELENPLRKALIESVQDALAEDGCAVVHNFFSKVGLQALLGEAKARHSKAYYSPNKKCNIYLGTGATELPPDHPRNIFLERNNGFITADLYDEATVSRRLYFWEPLKRFIADCLGKEELYIYDDPVSNMIVNVSRPGQQFNWHFDTNEFTITMLLQPSDAGGIFEYVPNLRKPGDECYDDVRQVLGGDSKKIKQLVLNAGDMQIFLGRFSLHHVTKNTGVRDRLLLIMSFTEQPGVVGSMYRVKDLYGKVTKEHHDNHVDAMRSDQLLD